MILSILTSSVIIILACFPVIVFQIVEEACTNLLPNVLCEYLYNLSEIFTRFYTSCQVCLSLLCFSILVIVGLFANLFFLKTQISEKRFTTKHWILLPNEPFMCRDHKKIAFNHKVFELKIEISVTKRDLTLEYLINDSIS